MSNPIDDHVRLTLRMRRRVLGISEAAFADSIGVSVAELRVLERGRERISASVLLRMTTALDMRISDVFEGFV